MEPIIPDYHITAWAYFASIMALVLVEGLVRLPTDFALFIRKGHPQPLGPIIHSRIYVLVHKLSTLPLPFIFTNHRGSDVVRLSAFIGLNILWGWNRLSEKSDFALYGWLTIANGGICLLMAARNNILATVARVPSTTLLMYHRWTGRTALVHSTIHFVMVTRRWLTTKEAAEHFRHRFIHVGLVAWLALCILAVTSISLIRRRSFEAFYYSHFVFLAFVIGGMIHVPRPGQEFFLPGLSLWVIDRLIRFYYNFRPARITDVAQYEGNLTKLRISGVSSHQPARIVWIQIPNVSFLNWHPFTLASAGPGDEVTVAIRGLGSYTRTVQVAVEVARHTSIPSEEFKCLRVRVDGPYGVSGIRWGLYPVIVIVAGGIGITPGLSIASYIMQQASRAAGPGNCQGWHIHFVWVVKCRAHVAWFTDALSSLKTMASVPSTRATFELTIHVTQEHTSNDANVSEKKEIGISVSDAGGYDGPGSLMLGRPNLPQVFKDLRDMYPTLDAAVSVCGPRSLVKGVRTAAAMESCLSGVFHVEDEAFEL
ncbi:ferric reductase NAD binding domain-containing protein [Aspergillus alliaceus]|uniref:Ferric reductase NAD binding domain-containing protein n=1 Tax=Petromyces alliaceus TaxID=209559 RepID=A0A5N7CGX9_PETAA|nr:ferric reductase NAD binding domain-containing protein [Aspergillus alliaceus]